MHYLGGSIQIRMANVGGTMRNYIANVGGTMLNHMAIEGGTMQNHMAIVGGTMRNRISHIGEIIRKSCLAKFMSRISTNLSTYGAICRQVQVGTIDRTQLVKT